MHRIGDHGGLWRANGNGYLTWCVARGRDVYSTRAREGCEPSKFDGSYERQNYEKKYVY